MDDQFRNRFRRYDGAAPIRPRPNAMPQRPQPLTPPRPTALPSTPTVQPPQPQPATAPPVSVPPVIARPEMPSRPAESVAEVVANPSVPATVSQQAPPEAPAQLPPASRPGKRIGRRKLKMLASIPVILVVLGGVFWFVVKPHLSAPQQPVNRITGKPTTAQSSGMIRLVAVGDSMTYNSINTAAQTNGGYNYLPLMAAIKPLFNKADVRICSQTVPAAGTAVGISAAPNFNAPKEFAKGLEDVGCNVIDMASPDANDKGQAAIDASVGNFDGHTNLLAIAGANRSADEQNKIRYFTVGNLKFAYLSYTTTSVAKPTPYGVNIYSDALADAQIKEAHTKANIVLVSMHWGDAQAADENSSQDTIAQHLASDNVDIVIGNGPYVVQPVKVLSGTNGHQTLVWFSLGDFLTAKVPVENVIGGMAVMDIDPATQKLHNPRLLPLYMHYEWTADQKQRQSDADLAARKNFQLVPLDQAADLLAKSQNGTTVQAQQDRLKGIVNKYFQIPLITSNDL